jgi:hypothetical protein
LIHFYKRERGRGRIDRIPPPWKWIKLVFQIASNAKEWSR